MGQRPPCDQRAADAEYHTRDFERLVALQARTQAIARHLTDFLKQTERFAKTIVVCVNQEHALEMRRVLVALNTDLVRKHPDYVCRVTADEGDVGSSHRSRFRDVETTTPVILTTSHLLTTGVDAPTCKNVVLVRAVGSMPEFKADHRPRDPATPGLRQARLQHRRLHGHGDREVRRSRFRPKLLLGIAVRMPSIVQQRTSLQCFDALRRIQVIRSDTDQHMHVVLRPVVHKTLKSENSR